MEIEIVLEGRTSRAVVRKLSDISGLDSGSVRF